MIKSTFEGGKLNGIEEPGNPHLESVGFSRSNLIGENSLGRPAGRVGPNFMDGWLESGTKPVDQSIRRKLDLSSLITQTKDEKKLNFD